MMYAYLTALSPRRKFKNLKDTDMKLFIKQTKGEEKQNLFQELFMILCNSNSQRATRASSVINFTIWISVLLSPFSIFGGVDPNGAYNQNIPIEVPAGRAGLKPELGLSYSSSGGNGALGMGWGISFPVISRVGNGGGLHYNGTDSYSAMGARLSFVNDANGGHYETQNQDWSRYYPVGQCGDAPCTWIVKTNDNKTLYFGNGDSFLPAYDMDGSLKNGHARAWALSRITDQWGNSIFYKYQQSGGQIYLSQVTYNLGATLPTFYAINLQYESRPDVETTYYGGRSTTSLRLTTVTVSRGEPSYFPSFSIQNNLIRSYNLTYALSPASGRSLIKKLTVTTPTQTVSELTFDYNGSYVNTSDLKPQTYYSALGITNVETGDFNGDGFSDMGAYAGGTTWCISLGSIYGLQPQFCPGAMGTSKVAAGDFNGDGKTDIIGYTGSGHVWCLAYGTSSGFSGQWCIDGIATGLGDVKHLVGDFNGDGRDDLAVWVGDLNGSWEISYGQPSGLSGGVGYTKILDPIKAYENNPASPISWQNPTRFNPQPVPKISSWAKVGDYNGDGFADLAAWVAGNIWCISYGSPSGMQAQICTSNGVSKGDDSLAADFNNDGFTDIAAFDGSNWCISYGQNYGFRPQTCMPAIGVSPKVTVPGDYNGDGKLDIAAYTNIGTSWCVANGNGSGFNGQYCTGNGVGSSIAYGGDYNGDGYSDFGAYTGNSPTWAVTHGQGYLDADRIIKVTSSTGSTESITYTDSHHTSGMYDPNESNSSYRANSSLYFVVSQITTQSNMDLSEDGQLDYRQTNYSYSGSKIVATGSPLTRGSLGFASMTATDTVSGNYVVTIYNQTKPFHGTIFSQTQYHGDGRKINEQFPPLQQQLSCSYVAGCLPDENPDLLVGRKLVIATVDLNGSPVESKVNTFAIDSLTQANALESVKFEQVLEYDFYGNATKVLQKLSANGAMKTRVKNTSYINSTDPTNYAIGLPYQEIVCTTIVLCQPGNGDFVSRVVTYYDGQSVGITGTLRAVTKRDTYFAALDINGQPIISSETFTYDNTGNIVGRTNGSGITTQTSFDWVFNLYPEITITSDGTSSRQTKVTYDLNLGKATYSKDSLTGIEIFTTLDDAGFVTKTETRNDGQVLSLSTSSHSDISTQPAWVQQCTYYGDGFQQSKCTKKFADAFGRKYKEQYPDYVASVNSSDETIMTIERRYDELGREKKVSEPYAGAASTFKWNLKTYDTSSRIIGTEAWDGIRKTATTYLTDNLPQYFRTGVITEDSDHKKKLSFVNVHEKTVKTIDAYHDPANSTNVTYDYDGLGRLYHVNATAGETDIGYLGNTELQASIDDHNVGKTEYTYYLTPGTQNFGKIKTETRNGFTATFEYNAGFGRVSKVTKAAASNGSVESTILYTYDETDLPYSSGRLTTLTYNAAGFTIQERYTYDIRGEAIQTVRRISSTTQTLCSDPDAIPCLQTFGRTKDKLGRVTDMLYPDGSHSVVQYVDDYSTHVSKILHNGTTYASYSNYTYDNTPRIGTITYGNGVEHNYAYQTNTGLLDTFQVKAADSHSLINLAYSYDAGFRINSIQDSIIADLSIDFAYDSLNRIQSATLQSGTVRNYNFDRKNQIDSVGNLTQKDRRKLTYAGNTYPVSDALYDQNQGQWIANQTFTWSASGSLLTKGPFSFGYDSNNMMTESVEVDSNNSANVIGKTKFYYDHSGQRFLKSNTRGSVKINTWYLGDGLEYREEYTGVNAISAGNFYGYQATKYIYGTDDKKLASITGNVHPSPPVAGSNSLLALADSYSSHSASGLSHKIYYTFYGIVANENFGKVARISSLSLLAMLLLLYLILSQRKTGHFPIWMRLTATGMLVAFVSVNCGSSNSNVPGLGSTTTGALISELYTGLPSGTVYYSHNHLGSGALVTDSAGSEVFRITYTEYGEIDLVNSGKWNSTTEEFERNVSDAEIAITAVKYTGQEYDPETGFYYYNARYYDPQLGVFTTADSEFDTSGGNFGFNRHMYVSGNPVMSSDPSGHFAWLIPLIAAAVSATTSATVVAAQHNWNFRDNWGAIGTAFAIGAVSGFAGGAAGVGASAGYSGAAAAIVGGMVGGAAGGFTSGALTAWSQGKNFGDGISAGLIGGLFGAYAGAAGGAAGFGGLSAFGDGFFGTVASGAMGGAVGGFTGGTLHGLSDGKDFGDAAMDGLTGAGLGGAIGGALAAFFYEGSHERNLSEDNAHQPDLREGLNVNSGDQFGPRTFTDSDFHYGADYPTGGRRMPISVPADGIVETVNFGNAFRDHYWGNHMIVDHGNGLKTLYAHMSLTRVTRGTPLFRGQSVGLTGATGKYLKNGVLNPVGAHLHYGVKTVGYNANTRFFADPRKFDWYYHEKYGVPYGP
jgi:RHS repeat-associated protein